MVKTTIAISRENRERLQNIKMLLEKKRNRFIDMDETVTFVLNSIK